MEGSVEQRDCGSVAKTVRRHSFYVIHFVSLVLIVLRCYCCLPPSVDGHSYSLEVFTATRLI